MATEIKIKSCPKRIFLDRGSIGVSSVGPFPVWEHVLPVMFKTVVSHRVDMVFIVCSVGMGYRQISDFSDMVFSIYHLNAINA